MLSLLGLQILKMVIPLRKDMSRLCPYSAWLCKEGWWCTLGALILSDFLCSAWVYSGFHSRQSKSISASSRNGL